MDAAAREVLVPEARELLQDMERALLETEEHGPTQDAINAIFRAAHTIKGSAGLFGLDLIVSFTQLLESVLDFARSGDLILNGELVSQLLKACDYIGKLVDNIERETEDQDPDPALRAQLIADMKRALGEPTTQLTRSPQQPQERPGAEGHYHLSLRFGPRVLHQGMDPLAFIVYLRQLGTLLYVHTSRDELPPADQLDPTLCYLSFEIGLRTQADRGSIERAFELVADGGSMSVLPPESRAADYIQVIRALPNGQKRLGELLVAAGALREADLHMALEKQRFSAQPGPVKPLGQVLLSEQLVAQPVLTSALGKQKQSEERRTTEQRVLKIDAAKLDQLINLMGELVIASEGARLGAAKARQSDLVEAMGKVSQLVEQVRDRTLNLRMIPIGEVFQRFPRVVRDVSRELGKDIQLIITGAEAELDKSMVDKLSDPLLHIVRNAMDHGLEPIEERLRAGKPGQGRLHLHAYHDSGCIVIEIKDDGRGLDRDRILAKAIERGLIPKDAVLSESEVHQLLFLPGFSTAAKVTDLSGRGVGMDVVKRNVEQLRGEIHIASKKGVGTRFRLRLPLTLAIIDGFQVAVDDTVFVLPLDSVVECTDMSGARDGNHLFSLRGQPLPFVRLRELFGLQTVAGARESLVVVSQGAQRVGLVVDRLLGDTQAVIKPLGQLFRSISAVSSSTILGDGTVALVLDVPTLVACASEQSTSQRGTRPLTH